MLLLLTLSCIGLAPTCTCLVYGFRASLWSARSTRFCVRSRWSPRVPQTGVDTAVCFVTTQAFSKALRLAQAELDQLKADVSQGKLIPQFGSKADSICNKVSRLGEAPWSQRQDVMSFSWRRISEREGGALLDMSQSSWMDDLSEAAAPALHVSVGRSCLLLTSGWVVHGRGA